MNSCLRASPGCSVKADTATLSLRSPIGKKLTRAGSVVSGRQRHLPI
jgi:hypothetical protein